MDDDTRLEMVDRYLLGQMDQDERQEFERLIADDRKIKELVEGQQTLIRGMQKYQEKAEFFDMLATIKKEGPAPKKDQSTAINIDVEPDTKSPIKIRKLRYTLAIAAGIALVITGVLLMLDSKINPADLAQSNFAFHTDILSGQLEASGATEDINKELIPYLQRGIQSFNQSNYNQAKIEFQEFKNQAKARNYLAILNDFYLAQIAFYQNRPDETIELLTPFRTERGLPIESSIKWYLALAYLKKYDKNNAEKLLDDLRTSSDYGARAEKMLGQLQ